MIELKPVNIKRFDLIKSSYVKTMSQYLQRINHKPLDEIEEYFTRIVNGTIKRKWDLRHHHFREIYLMPEKQKIGFVWYRTLVDEMFSDVVVLQWIDTEIKSNLRKYAKEIFDALNEELKKMEINRMVVETYGEFDALAGMWEDMGFSPVRVVMNRQIQ